MTAGVARRDAPHLAAIWRHPVKGIGREALQSAELSASAPLPGDRAWALLHGEAEDTDAWQPRRNFLVTASGPRLAQVEAVTEGGRITLTHPQEGTLTIDPGRDGARLIDWVRPLWPEDRPVPMRLAKAPPEGMADNGQAQVAILNRASLRALSERVGQKLEETRFRGNLVLDGLPPWGEFDWIGTMIRIGPVTLRVTDRIGRCRATEASPVTGRRDADTLAALRDGWGHRDFGVYATVLGGGKVTVGDAVTE
ncbi:MAG: MOSC domain-containing protein [Jannaschia sp.]